MGEIVASSTKMNKGDVVVENIKQFFHDNSQPLPSPELQASKFGYTTTMVNFINIQNTIFIQHYQNFILNGQMIIILEIDLNV